MIDDVVQPLIDKVRQTIDVVSIHPAFDINSRQELSAQLALCATTLIIFVRQLDYAPLSPSRKQELDETIKDTSTIVNQVDFFIKHLAVKHRDKIHSHQEQRL